MTMKKEPQISDQRLIKILNEQDRLQTLMEQKDKTIVLYDLFKNKEEERNALINLHTCAYAILDKNVKINISTENEDGYLFYTYHVDPSYIPEVKISKRVFEVEDPDENGNPGLDNIWIYQKQGTNYRVVVIPIQKEFIDITSIRKDTDNDILQNKKRSKQIHQSGKQYQELNIAHKEWDDIKDKRFAQRCKIAAQKHLKMFKIEVFLATLIQKTKKVSICSFVEVAERRFKELSGYQNEFNQLFTVPTGFIPQYIFHGWSEIKKKAQIQANREEVTTIFTIESKFELKCNILDDQYFFPTNDIRTKIYQNMQEYTRADSNNNNPNAITTVITEFIDSWSRITLDTCQAFYSVVKQVQMSINQQNKSEDLNTSFELNSSKDIQNILTFAEISEKYILPGLWFQQRERLESFYTPERLKKIKPEKGEPTIPPSIQNLAFCHFLYQIIAQFSQNYRNKEVQIKGDQGKLLILWKDVLKSIYELVKSINGTFLSKSENLSCKCEDIQQFFDFLLFTLRSLQRIQLITKRDFATATSLKTFFEQQLRPKKDKLLSYIVANQKDIQSDQPIHYYDLYLLIITQNSTKDIQNDIEYIYLHIHELKAFCIATKYICDNKKLIEAIKSYALIGIKYKTLSENKKKLIDILTIQSRMAKLLKIVNQEQFASQIYIKNKEFEFAHKCYTQVLLKYTGDAKAKKLLTWGKLFEEDFEYDLAQSYYRKAYSYAKSVQLKQLAVKNKMELVCNMKKELGENDTLPYDNFLKDKDLIKFTGQMDLTQMLKKIRKCLKWDKHAECSIILEGNSVINEDSDDHFFELVEESSLKK